jgi:hypothetical protein
VIGGLDYTYAIRGDNQDPTQFVTPELQIEALKALVQSISPTTLTLSEKLIEIIPPRPLGYSRSRETINTRSGLTFDPIAPAETAADMTLSLLLRPERASRLVEFHARDTEQPGLNFVLNELTNATWKSDPLGGLQGEVRRAVNNVVLLNLMRLANSENANVQARALVSHHLTLLHTWLTQKAANSKSEDEKAHLLYGATQIKQFQDNPSLIEGIDPLSPPEGSPIGTDEIFCSFYD